MAQGVPRHDDAARLSHSIEYIATRNGENIGSCVFQFERSSETLVVRIDVELIVRILSIPVYRWTHHSIERWVDDRLVKMTADTDDNGARRHVEAVSDQAGSIRLAVEGKITSVDGDAVPASFWNPAVLKSKTVINAVSGEAAHPVVRRVEDSGVGPPVNGRAANVFLLTSAPALKQELWFGANDRLVQFIAFAPDGSGIVYHMVAEP